MSPSGNDLEPHPVRTRRDGAVLEITIDRRAKGNAIDGAVTSGLTRALRELEETTELRVGLLTAAGTRHFCVGSDLSAAEQDPGQLIDPVGGFGGVVRYPRTKPLVAAINGDAVGGGMELALACDFALASDTARFGFPEASIGVVAGAGGLVRLPRRIPAASAMELLLTGRLVDAAEALAIGLIARVVPAARLADEAMRSVRAIAQASPSAVRATRELAGRASIPDEETLWRLNDAVLARILAGPDAAEGRRAFLARRAPNWAVAADQPD
ncbi:enoyl-CoA hydratase-related protein [Conexibacter stalactiti]|uniref:Enoyl-CoA hydratase-related protein n=1 Tax=Conexibacter stalactiti TaxID=1940611 RepID=A0ABU4HYT2_9ACTN|nr:enoyl-CoA hydratase-related protein [Conexibacter stalactiti]MDW5597635.1 enoyl-CoA hydratase-related protein [Conexibacter stalactiti]MEC5038277.1 enoyl-CoA hydratase-related protein [Conexibacter stalactiti]